MRGDRILSVVCFAAIAATAVGQPPQTPPKFGRPGVAPQLKGREQPQPPFGLARDEIRVEFQGEKVRAESNRDVSNVVLEYADGAREKFDDLEGRRVELQGTGPHAGKTIVKAWVKSGANLSGDGPGYGRKFEALPPKP